MAVLSATDVCVAYDSFLLRLNLNLFFFFVLVHFNVREVHVFTWFLLCVSTLSSFDFLFSTICRWRVQKNSSIVWEELSIDKIIKLIVFVECKLNHYHKNANEKKSEKIIASCLFFFNGINETNAETKSWMSSVVIQFFPQAILELQNN